MEPGSLAAFGLQQWHAVHAVLWTGDAARCGPGNSNRGRDLPSQHGEIAHVWISKGSGEGKAVLEPPLTLI